jgi:DNA primase
MSDAKKMPWISDDEKERLKREVDFIALVKFLFGQVEMQPARGGDQFKAKCPFPDCPDKRGDYPFGINAEGKFNCFHCGRGGDVLKLIMLARGCSFYEAKHFLLLFVRGEVREDMRGKLPAKPVMANPKAEPKPPKKAEPFGRELTGLRVEGIPAIEEKGITPKTARKFGVGYCSQGMMKGRVVVPVHDSKTAGAAPENVLFYGGYSITKKQKEYGDWKFPDGCEKGSALYNLNRLRVEDKKLQEVLAKHGVLVVESFWNVLKLYQAGIKNVVALMGTALTGEQEKLLLDFTDKVTLWLDEDKAGLKGLQNILRLPRDGGTNGLLYKTHLKIISPTASLPAVGDRVKPYQFDENEIKQILSA